MALQTFPFLWDQLINQMMISIFGSSMMMGLVLLFFIIILGLALRLNWEIQILSVFFFAFLFLRPLIPWLSFVMYLLLGLVIGIYMIYLFFRG